MALCSEYLSDFNEVKIKRSEQVFVAQWTAHQTSNLGVVGSSPTGDAIFSFNLIIQFPT